MNDAESYISFDSEVRLKLMVKYFDKDGNIKNKRFTEDIEYLEFVE
ncbi:MAG: hypothetical protein Q7R95_01865 [bacterium]|nr:hypothetical protein [bacterium]